MKTEPEKKAKMKDSVEQLSAPPKKKKVSFFMEKGYYITSFLP